MTVRFWSLPNWAKVVTSFKNINDSTNSIVKISQTADKPLTYFTKKVNGVITGVVNAPKGTVDILESGACQDGVCGVVNDIGVYADDLIYPRNQCCNYGGQGSSFCWL